MADEPKGLVLQNMSSSAGAGTGGRIWLTGSLSIVTGANDDGLLEFGSVTTTPGTPDSQKVILWAAGATGASKLYAKGDNGTAITLSDMVSVSTANTFTADQSFSQNVLLGSSPTVSSIYVSGTVSDHRVSGTILVSPATSDPAIETTHGNVIFNEAAHADADFRVESSGEANAIFLNAGTNHLAINAGETAFTTTIHNVDGEAVSVTATEVVINDDGITTVDFRAESDGEDEALFLDASANALYVNKGNTAFATEINSTNDVAITVGAAGVIFNEDGHATNDFRVESDGVSHAVFVDAGTNQVLLGASSAGSDAFLYVSGAKGAFAGGHAGVAVVDGDAYVSGALTLGFAPTEADDGNTTDFTVHTKNLGSAFYVDGDEGYVSVHGFADGTKQSAITGDVIFYCSGAKDGNADDGSDSARRALFQGDVIVSGAVKGYIQKIPGAAAAGHGDIDYLVGTGIVSISSASNGQVTITATGASTSATNVFTGVNTFQDRVIMTNDVSLGDNGEDGVYISGSVSDFNMTGTLKHAGGDAIEFAAAAEINTQAGALTLESAAAINYDGTSHAFKDSETLILTLDSATVNSVANTPVLTSNSTLLAVADHVVPNADITYDLGNSALRWRNVYTGDLHLKNDRGNWTVIEEPSFLSLRNNNTGKRYKLLMEEIDPDEYGPGMDE